jgi:hypothetical protein
VVNAILETSLLIDLTRSYAPALAWAARNAQCSFAINSCIWMEVMTGGQNKIDRLKAARFMRRFELVYLTQDDQMGN